MEMKQISETTLKITISLQDLEERGMEVRDFLIPQEKTEEFFYTVMDELDLPENFKNSGMLSFRVTPKKDRVDVFVTKSELNSELNFEELSDLDLNEMSGMTPEEFFKTLEQGMLTKGDAKAHAQLEAIEKASEEREEAEQLDYTHYVLDFPDLKSVVAFAHTVSFAIEASELFKHQNTYHMTILIDLINKPSYYANVVYARLLEHASQGTRTRSYLLEHGLPLILDDAVTALKRVELV